MTVDERLRTAGERHRAVRTDPVPADVAPTITPRRRMLLPLAAAAAVVLVAALAVGIVHHERSSTTDAVTTGTVHDLVGPTWTLTSWTRNGRTVTVTGESLTVKFTNQQIEADDACNELFAPIRITSGAIHVDTNKAGSTAVGCGLDRTGARTALDKLAQSNGIVWRIAAGRLRMIGSGITLELANGASPSLLAGTSWTLKNWTTDGRKHNVATATVDLRFPSSTSLVVPDPCGALTATVTGRGDLLVLSDIVHATAPCPSSPRATSPPPYDQLLTGAVRWGLAYGTLTLVHADYRFVYGLAGDH